MNKLLHKKLNILWKIKIWCNKQIHETNQQIERNNLS